MSDITPLKAIRLKCLDCCCGSSNEVKACTIEKCPLFFYRSGHNPKRKGLGNPNALFNKNSSADGEIIDEDI